ncbi:hypothetical protein F4779DRAFT_50368 [Xylariaceae sp. FL0662B]|nr:hypothetical protein F4779DRAFT_50368 [Xylariaceae sp. FL0662B]
MAPAAAERDLMEDRNEAIEISNGTNILDAQSLRQIWNWNAKVPAAVNRCVHDLFATVVGSYPERPAVCAWDGDLTYEELDHLSTRLAHHLVGLGLDPETLIPLCFEKSKWVPVAVFGVMKVGAASVALDVTQPEDRLKTIVGQVDASIVLSSTTNKELASRIGRDSVIIPVPDVLMEANGHSMCKNLPVVQPSSMLYVVFTSGSTGIPKGVIITHSNFSSAIRYQQDALGFTSSSRVYDFVSYAFDVSWSNILHTLTAGACLCIPSQDQRQNNIAESIRSLRANYADLTPSIFRLIKPTQVKCLQHITFSGEVLLAEDAAIWKDAKKVINTYGPAECTVKSTISTLDCREGSVPDIGYRVGVNTWLVDPGTNELSSIGGVGEIWLEGPLVGRGYLHDPDKTQASFIEDPEWLLRGTPEHPGRRGRLYKTGDLARYRADGSLVFIGRMDTQVKLHGQRVELCEVEHHVHECLSSKVGRVGDAGEIELSIVTEIIRLKNSDSQMLVVFLSSNSNQTTNPTEDREQSKVHYLLANMEEQLRERLPIFMIPAAYAVIDHIPMTATGKMDRKALRKLGESMTLDQLVSRNRSERRKPATEMERRLQLLWADVLRRSPDTISIDDSFLQIGGDSITAMRLVAAAREQGLAIKVSDIFNQPRLYQLAPLLTVSLVVEEVSPFALLRPTIYKQDAQKWAASLCGLNPAQIEDIFPCTPLQAGLLALTCKRPGDYMSRNVLTLGEGVELSRFRTAVEQVSLQTPILRTRIIELQGQGLVQVVVKEPVDWLPNGHIETVLSHDKAAPMGLGTRLVRFGIADGQPHSCDGKRQFIWTLHHAVYDGWSLPLLLEQIVKTYQEGELRPLAPFQPFVKYVSQLQEEAALKYWKSQLGDCKAVIFPPMPSSHYQPKADQMVTRKVTLGWPRSDITASTMLRAAWAITVARYTHAPDVVFGATVSGRQAPVVAVEAIAGPTIATVPIRMRINWGFELDEFLQQVQSQATEMTAFEQVGLQKIRLACDVAQATQFQTLLLVQPIREALHSSTTIFDATGDELSKMGGMDDHHTYALALICELEVDGVRLEASFDSFVVDKPQLTRMMQQFDHALRQMCNPENVHTKLGDLDLLSLEDLRDLWAWNSTIPAAVVDRRVHEMISAVAQRQPSASAICSWDGELTHGELDTLSTRLAHQLVSLGVGAGIIVPLCFEKSMWSPVAMLGVTKAGGASVALDVTQPKQRLQMVVDTVGGSLILSSSAQRSLAEELYPNVVVVSKDFVDANSQMSTNHLPSVAAEDLLYIVFTSGSTGTPKGVMITHENFSTALENQTESLGFGAQSRVFDFASYAFDAAWYNLLHTLYAGGCLCIPSSSDRQNDISGSIVRLGATFANLTPKVAELLDAAALSTLDVVELSGEAADPGLAARIRQHSKVRFAYGPAECSIMSTVSEENPETINIGTGIGICTWVTDLNSTSKLASIGCVGELWIEGPLVGQGYLKDPDNTGASFTEDTPWLLRGGPENQGRRGRLYRTGDLVKYQPDGSLLFVGRRDMQVKIHGQRVELGDVEHHAREFLASRMNVSVIAEVVIPRDSKSPMLVLFCNVDPSARLLEEESRSGLRGILSGLEEHLTRQLPVYMVPAAYIHVEEIPMTATGKVNRQQLRRHGGALTRDQLAALNPTRGERRAPTTQIEQRLQMLWADVLDLSPEAIGIDDSFLQIGGDSIAAMRLVAAAREQGLVMTVTEVFNQPRLRDLAPRIILVATEENEDISPFCLLNVSSDKQHARNMAAALCDINPMDVEDIFPCTPLQERLLAMSMKHTGDYVNQNVFTLQEDVDLVRLRTSVETVLASNAILRTRIIDLPGQGLVQVVVRDRPMRWLTGDSIDDLVKLDQQKPMGLGSELTHLGIVDGSHTRGKRYLFWSLHHAIYDGWSFPLLLDQIGEVYKGSSIEDSAPFQLFIKYVMDLNLDHHSTREYWASQFENCEATTFPALPSSRYQPRANHAIKHEIRGLQWPENDTTASTAVRTSWAILSARYTNASDVIFGAIVNGRNAPAPRVDRMTGPTIATVPVRVRIDWTESVNGLLQQIQDQATGMAMFEQTGLQRIRQDVTQIPQFQTLLVIQPARRTQIGQAAGELFENEHDGTGNSDGLGTFHTYALALVCELGADGLSLHASYDTNVLATDQAAKLLEQLEHLIRQLCDPEKRGTRVADLQQLSPQDLRDLWSWNATVPPVIDRCVHDVIAETARKHHTAPAVCAWDGELTYGKLDELSTRLAHDLVDVGPGTIVPICIEKSMWVVVAMLSVLKAGGAFVSLDPEAPASRRQYMLDTVGARSVLTSKRNAALFDMGSCNVMLVDQPVLDSWNDDGNKSRVTGNDAAYVIFTSGSTGRPKGVLVEHQTVTTSCTAHAKRFGICETSRILQFSSYTFDASIIEILTALMHGACVCVPSDSSRLSDLTSVFSDLQVNWALLTPTVARLLDPAKLPTLKTLVLGAEAVHEQDLDQWKGSLHLLNAYGPTECAVCCTVKDYDSAKADVGTIGRPVGSVAWVVNPNDHDQLVPLGAVGELLVEGAILARGYLNDPEKTAAAFIDSPSWLQRGGPNQPGRRGRLYKTGDLVKFHPDGSHTFVGRKDQQVKIRGQRVELHEVEHHVKASIAGKTDVSVVAEMIPSQNGNRETLVAFIVPVEAAKMTKEQLVANVAELTSGLDDRLSNIVPSYMIPSNYLPLTEVPMTAAGKTNRRKLIEIGASSISQDLLQNGSIVDPSNDTERTLQAIFGDVLNIPASSISVKAPFLRLGGDSISAMQVVSRCRQHGMILTVTDLLKKQTIQEVSMSCQGMSEMPADSKSFLAKPEQPGKLYPLSPAQRMFFSANLNSLDYFNQFFLLRIRQPIHNASLQAAAKAVVDRHSMLRARFRQTENNGWMQFVQPESCDAFAFACHEVQTRKEIQVIAKERQTKLSIRHGPVFAVDAFTLSDGRQVVLLSAHHLVVDLVSWRIIWHDLQNHLQHRPLGPNPTSFITWNQMQQDRHQSADNIPHIPPPARQSNFQFWSLAPEENTIEHQESFEVKLEREATRLCLGESNDAFQSEPPDIMVAAMLFAFQEIFPERDLPILYTESHGRELADDAGLDLSETVGWFTKLHPLQIRGKYRHSMVDLVRVVKDLRKRKSASNLSLLDDNHDLEIEHQELERIGEMEILLNYAGAYQQLENADSLFGRFDSQDGDLDIPYASPNMQRFAIIEVNALVEDGEARFGVYFSRRIKHRERLKQWASLFVPSLQSLCETLAHMPRSYTLVDFPLLRISYPGLDVLLEQIGRLGIKSSDVEDIYPCTPIQEGIIMSQKRGVASYRNCWIWDVNASDSVTPETLAQAWRAVGQRHSILSTVFIEHPETAAMLQLVLHNAEPRIDQIHTHVVDPGQALQDMSEPSFASGQPQWAVTLATSQTGQVACRLDIDHTLCDAASMQILLHDLGRAYTSVPLPTAPRFRNVVEYLELTPRSERLEYWVDFLHGAQPCLFPATHRDTESGGMLSEHGPIDVVSAEISSQIYDFCREKGITRSAFLHVAWALTLSQCTSMAQVCFGYLAAGRNSEIKDADQIVGPMISMLIGYVDLEKDLNEVLQVTHQNSVNHFAHQHTSLAEILHELDIHNKPLFNTTVSVRQSADNTEDRGTQESQKLTLVNRSGVDPHEYDLSLGAVQNGSATELALTFRTPSISPRAAEGVAHLLENAIVYILQEGRSSVETNHQLHRDTSRAAFFRWRVGVEEDVASTFWKQQLDGVAPALFPPPNPYPRKPVKYQILEHSIRDINWCSIPESASALVWSSWAVCQAQSLGLSEAVFGALVTDDCKSDHGSQQKVSSTTACIPVRIAIDPGKTIRRFLYEVEAQQTEIARYAHVGLPWISQLSKDARQACDYQTVVIIRQQSGQQETVATNAAMTLQCILEDNGLFLRVDFDERVVALPIVRNLAHRFEHVIRQLCELEGTPARIASLNILSRQDLQDIWSWNSTVPAAANRCVHELVTEQAHAQPGATAIHSWVGELTYKEVDELSTRLAHNLIDQGVSPGSIVALCFEKCMWTTVAMLGVMKAGGASIALDVTQPKKRQSDIISQARPVVIVSSEENSSLATSLLSCEQNIVVNRANLFSTTPPHQHLPSVDPHSTLYLAFTSGSTGKPKGVMITHANLTSAIKHQQKALGFDPSSRVYDFASYAFDVAWYNAFQTLAAGGCLCVPSEYQRRNQLSSSIIALRANTATLTPTVLDMVEDSALKTLRILETGGEAVTQAQIDRVRRFTNVRIAYGPVECTIGVTWAWENPGDCDIGRGLGACTWVVDPDVPERLACVGCVGELWIEGPLVGGGYLGDLGKEADSFVEDPPWLLRGDSSSGRPGRRGRLYRTGDLVRYKPDGSLVFVGRKDTQVKIRGQRVEFGEVEHHMRKCLLKEAHNTGKPDISVVAELVRPLDSEISILAAFLSINLAATAPDKERKSTLRQLTTGLSEKLAKRLPAYMVPAAYIPIDQIPMTASGKTNRRELRQIAAGMTLEQLAAMNPARNARRMPTNNVERQLQQLWAKVLKIESLEEIGIDDSFLKIGGDSIAAMRLVAAAREQGLGMAVADVFKKPKLCDLAEVVRQSGPQKIEEIRPLSLLRLTTSMDERGVRQRAAELCGIDSTEVEDVFPCTPLQEGLLALTAKRAGDYVGQNLFVLRHDVRLDRFREALDRVVASTPILRTRIVDLPEQGLVQVVVKKPIVWVVGNTVQEIRDQVDHKLMSLGSPLTSFGIIEGLQAQGGSCRFLLILHHAIYDGWSLPLLLDQVEKLYEGQEIMELAPFQPFVKYIIDLKDGQIQEYWGAQFENCEAVIFPSLPSSEYQPQASQSVTHEFKRIKWPQSDITASTVIYAAWTLLAARYTNSSDVTFGTTVNGRQAPVVGIESMPGPTIATVPMRVQFDSQQSVGVHLQHLQRQVTEMTPFEQSGLQRIRHLCRDIAESTQFQTLLVIQNAEQNKQPASKIFELDENGGSDVSDQSAFNTYALALICDLEPDGARLQASFDTAAVNHDQAVNIVKQLEHTIRQICNPAFTQVNLGDLNMLSSEDLCDIWAWNAKLPPAVDQCIHDLVAFRAQSQPSAPAICAWDGKLTYREVNELSTLLAHQLVHQGVQGTIVPLFFEKSMWTTVAMIGVMKAGAASVALDVTQPEDWLRTVVNQVSPVVTISSRQSAALITSINCCDHNLIVDSTSLRNMTITNKDVLPRVDPRSTLYVAFTSGSTGEPKEVMITHSNLSSAIEHQKPLGFTTSSRVYDFASYAFDVTWYNAFQTLVGGGCLCVPSEYQRKNKLSSSIIEFGANSVTLTPTVLDVLDDSVLGVLDIVEIGGEAVSQANIDRIQKFTKARIAYGPVECTIGVTWAMGDELNDRDIGRGLGACTWVVDPISTDTLVGVGCIGELLIEGPLVGEGYYNDSTKTAAVFIDDPPWLLRGAPGYPGRGGRLYKTGDLVRYNSDGSLVFVGRKDAQVKIRGQRVELSEVEHHVRTCLTNTSGYAEVSVTAEVITPSDSDNTLLLAFISPTGSTSRIQEGFADAVAAVTHDINRRLAVTVPSYMIPSGYIPLSSVPKTATGKTDRRSIRTSFNARTLNELRDLLVTQSQRKPPSTAAEKLLQELWSTVLRIEIGNIHADDSFFELGGDSIQAMRLVGLTRSQGSYLTVSDIFLHRRLHDMARLIRISTPVDEAIAPFALLNAVIDISAARSNAAAACDVDEEQVEDIYPCIPLQEGLLAMTARRQGDYVANIEFDLAPDIIVDKLKSAWDNLVHETPILRTRIIDLPGQGLVQVVLKEKVPFLMYETNSDRDRIPGHPEMGLGTPLHHVVLHKGKNEERTIFKWSIHHALYDGWSLSLLLEMIREEYFGNKTNCKLSLQPFVKHVVESSGTMAENFWEQEFTGLQAERFPSLPFAGYQPRANTTIHRATRHVNRPPGGFTISTIIRSAWAILIANITASLDAIFGVVVTGRQAPVPDIELMAGPTIATVPVRVTVDRQRTLRQIFEAVEDYSIRACQFEQTGLQHIQRVSTEAREACSFQSLLVVQPASTGGSIGADQRLFFPSGMESDNWNALDTFSTYAVTIFCEYDGPHLRLIITFDSSVLDSARVGRMMEQFDHLIHLICNPSNIGVKLDDLDMLSPRDLSDIWNWNSVAPLTVNECVHDLITQRVQQQPTAIAICGWDGELTYQEVDEFSSRLARHLINIGVCPGTIIPLCFEKSRWTSVAMLGVMKAGATSVALDITQPVDRLRAIVGQVRPSVMVSSAQSASLMVSVFSAEHNVVIEQASLLEMMSTSSLPVVNSKSTLYLAFTSGSTGEPKGVMISHANLSSAIKHQQQALGFTSTSRVYDFASYAFDVAWYNAFQTLAAGGCLCVPSEYQRKNELSSSILEFRANAVTLTPTVLDALDDSVLGTLRVLETGGEAVSQTQIDRIQKYTKARIAYGPVECTIGVTWAWEPSDRDIGRGLGACTWVVDSASRLAGIGCVGELWIEGPLVGNGYFNDPVKTAASHVEDPPWLLQGGGDGQPGRRGRLYKTGDLVKYKTDGSLVFVRRKDTQVKIRGQRVELAEVEHHIREALAVRSGTSDTDASIVAEVITPQGSGRDMLIALISPAEAETISLEELRRAVADLTNGINSRLATIIPSYMIPSGYIPLATVPRTATGKTDRRSLKAELCALPLHELRQRLVTELHKRPVETAAEVLVQRLWASVLGLEVDSIGANDNFFELGGDSIQAMRLSTAASREGMSVTVGDVMKQPRLDHLALCLHSSSGPSILEPARFSLLGADDMDHLVKDILAQVLLTDFEAQDILPVSHSQRNFVDGSVNGTPIGINHFFLDLPTSTNVSQLSTACGKLIEHYEILRTVFVAFKSKFYQVILKHLPVSLEVQDIVGTLSDYFETFRHEDGPQAAEFGRSFLRLVLLRSETGDLRLVIRISHAQYDGISFGNILSALADLYDGSVLPREPSLSSLIYLQSKDLHYSYWDRLLAKSSMSYMGHSRQPDSAGKNSFSVLRLEKRIPAPTASVSTTKATIFTSACAIMLQRITGSDDVLFGRVVSGRGSLPLELRNIVFPCITVLPVRVQVPPSTVTQSVSAQVREQYIAGLQYEHIGLPQLSSHCQSWPRGADEFGCITQYQNVDENPTMKIAGAAVPTQHYRAVMDEQGRSDTVQIVAVPAGSELNLIITAKSTVCGMDLLVVAMEELCCAIASF